MARNFHNNSSGSFYPSGCPSARCNPPSKIIRSPKLVFFSFWVLSFGLSFVASSAGATIAQHRQDTRGSRLARRLAPCCSPLAVTGTTAIMDLAPSSASRLRLFPQHNGHFYRNPKRQVGQHTWDGFVCPLLSFPSSVAIYCSLQSNPLEDPAAGGSSRRTNQQAAPHEIGE